MEYQKEKLFFTEITENEKRIINLIRGYISPYMPVEEFVDEVVNDTANKLLTKSINLQAFIEVMQSERNNQNLSDVQILARINQYKDYIANHKNIIERNFNSIFTDIISKLEGDIIPIEIYSRLEQLEEEEKALDRMKH